MLQIVGILNTIGPTMYLHADVKKRKLSNYPKITRRKK
jgi:hypothetical protein